MSPRQTLPPQPTYLSGWCGTNQHDRCRGTYAGQDCRCACHTTCPLCGQTLPVDGRARLELAAADNPPCPLDDP